MSEDLSAVMAEMGLESVTRFFECMSEAEELLTAYGFPPGRPSPFAWLAPPESLRLMVIDVYRAHARELVIRWMDHRKERPSTLDRTMSRLTRAEALAVLVNISNAAPLNETAAAAYVKLYREIFPRGNAAPEFHEPYPGAAEEAIREITRKSVKRKG